MNSQREQKKCKFGSWKRRLRKERLTSAEVAISVSAGSTGAYALLGIGDRTTHHFLVVSGTSVTIEGLSGSAGGTGSIALLAGRSGGI